MNAPPIGRPETWSEQSACWRSDLPLNAWDTDQTPELNAKATLICATCPVALECLLTYGKDPDIGIVGGLTPERRGELWGVTSLDIRPPHGTRSRYIGSSRWEGCRCDACRAAHAEYETEARARRKATHAAGRPRR